MRGVRQGCHEEGGGEEERVERERRAERGEGECVHEGGLPLSLIFITDFYLYLGRKEIWSLVFYLL